MKRFFNGRRREKSGGFSLTEATFSLGLLSFGFVAMAPLLAVNLNGSRQGREIRMEAEIAQGFADQADQGTLQAGTSFFDSDGQACAISAARYSAVIGLAPVAAGPGSESGALQRMTLQVTPVGDPGQARFYVRVLPTSP